MKVGFIGFGEVSHTLSSIFLSVGIEVLSSYEGRSKKTMDLIDSLDITVLDSFKDVISQSDIVISANSPKNALSIAKEYSKYCKCFYLDFNNVSPKTSLEIGELIDEDHFVDSVIMGRVNSEVLNIYLSGKRADELKGLLDGLLENCEYTINIRVISDKIADASRLKLLRSLYTKGVSALLLETFNLAEKLDLDDELWDVLALTENRDFETSSRSRIKSSYAASNRKLEELDELLEFLDSVEESDESKIMANAIRNKFSYLNKQ